MTLLVLDQFSGLNPAWVQSNRVTFTDLCELAKQDRSYKVPYLAEIDPADKTWRPSMGSTVYKADELGYAVVHMMRWDST